MNALMGLLKNKMMGQGGPMPGGPMPGGPMPGGPMPSSPTGAPGMGLSAPPPQGPLPPQGGMPPGAGGMSPAAPGGAGGGMPPDIRELIDNSFVAPEEMQAVQVAIGSLIPTMLVPPPGIPPELWERFRNHAKLQQILASQQAQSKGY